MESIALSDCEGAVHFQVRILGDPVSVEAFELDDGVPAGYQFQQLGDPGDELLEIVGRLIQKVRRTLAVKHITYGSFGLSIIDQCVRGHIEWNDPTDGQQPTWRTTFFSR